MIPRRDAGMVRGPSGRTTAQDAAEVRTARQVVGRRMGMRMRSPFLGDETGRHELPGQSLIGGAALFLTAFNRSSVCADT